jgi:hypothetical protein
MSFFFQFFVHPYFAKMFVVSHHGREAEELKKLSLWLATLAE